MHDFSPVAALADAVFSRENLLSARGIRSFAPSLRFVEDLCKDKTMLQEHRKSLISSYRQNIFPTQEALHRLRALQAEGEKRAELSGNRWDAQITGYERERFKLQATDLARYDALWQPYQEASKSLQQEEVRHFQADYHPEGKPKPSRLEIYRGLMDIYLTPHGLKWDREQSSGEYITHSKPVTPRHLLCFSLDRVKFNKPLNPAPVTIRYSRTGYSKTIEPAGIGFDIFLSILAVGASKKERPLITLSFDWLFPITHHYRHFKNEQELEALIAIYAEMYTLIRDDLENACLRTLSTLQ